jgi:hypothetical protein
MKADAPATVRLPRHSEVLNQISDNLWELERPMKAPCLRVGHRMTVARLASGALWVHSPVEFDPAIAQALAEIGTVAYFVAPSTFHDLYWPDWFSHYPFATFYCAPGVKDEHPDLPFHTILSETIAEPWESDLPKLAIRGMPKLNEFAFLHRPSRTLILTDLLFNFDAGQQNLVGKLFLQLNGIYGAAGCSRIFRRFIKDQNAFQQSIEEIMRWDFDRVIVGHGTIIDQDARAVVGNAMRWLKATERGNMTMMPAC